MRGRAVGLRGRHARCPRVAPRRARPARRPPAGRRAGARGRAADDLQPGQARRAGSPDPRRFATSCPKLDARCVIITGEGTTFSAGYDIGGAARTDGSPTRPSGSSRTRSPPRSTRSRPTRTRRVAALNGHTIGGGLELALACDLRIAAGTIALGMPPAKLGLVYSHTGHPQVHRHDRRAADTRAVPVGRRIDARTARAWGLVNAVSEDGRLAEEALELAAEIAAQRAARAGRQQAGDPRRARRPGELDPETERELIELRARELRLRGLPRGSPRVRREASASVAGGLKDLLASVDLTNVPFDAAARNRGTFVIPHVTNVPRFRQNPSNGTLSTKPDRAPHNQPRQPTQVGIIASVVVPASTLAFEPPPAAARFVLGPRRSSATPSVLRPRGPSTGGASRCDRACGDDHT